MVLIYLSFMNRFRVVVWVRMFRELNIHVPPPDTICPITICPITLKINLTTLTEDYMRRLFHSDSAHNNGAHLGLVPMPCDGMV